MNDYDSYDWIYLGLWIFIIIGIIITASIIIKVENKYIEDTTRLSNINYYLDDIKDNLNFYQVCPTDKCRTYFEEKIKYDVEKLK